MRETASCTPSRRCPASVPSSDDCFRRFASCSFASFEPLPLVRFIPERRISQEEALSLVRREPPPRQAARKEEQAANPWSGGEAPDVQTLSLAGDVEQMAAHMDIDDPFTKAMLDFDSDAGTHGQFRPPTADRQMLLAMERSDVYVIKPAAPQLPW